MSQKTKRRLTAIFGGMLLLTMAVTSFLILRSRSASGEDDFAVTGAGVDSPRVPVEVKETRRGSISSNLASSSTIEAEQTAEVLAKVDGMVTTVKVREGEYVKAGQLLATIEDEEKKLALDKARLRLGKANAEFERSKLSFEQQLISRFDYEKVLFDRDLAGSELETATLELRYTQVQAPFGGTGD